MVFVAGDPKNCGLPWPPLLRGRLIGRYKRFLADVRLDDGRVVTAHCPNSGRMTGCNEPQRPVYLSCHDNPRRKLKFTWELIEMPTSLVGVNTLVPNLLLAKTLRGGCIPELQGYTEVKTEVAVNGRSRLDIRLSGSDLPDCYIEIKNCTLVEKGRALFPDAPTTRGQKHLQDLVRLHRSGARSVMVYVIQRTDARHFAPADIIDPQYGRFLRQAAGQGVEILAYDVTIDLTRIALHRRLPVRL